MIDRVLIGLDGSRLAEAVLPYAITLAQAADAEILLVRAIPAGDTLEPVDTVNPTLLPYMAVMPEAHPTARDASPRAQRHEAEAYLDEVAARLGKSGVACRAFVIAGEPADVLVEEARLRDVSLILLGTHGRSGLGRWIYGSVAEAVLSQSPVPVLLVRGWERGDSAPASGAISTILVPLDGSATAEAALPLAAELGRILQAKLHLVRIVPPVTTVASGGVLGIDVASTALVEDLDENAAKEYLSNLVSSLSEQGLTLTAAVKFGQPASRIVAEASEQQADLIIMATHGRTGLARTLVGSVALRVLHLGQLPVLLVRPPAA